MIYFDFNALLKQVGAGTVLRAVFKAGGVCCTIIPADDLVHDYGSMVNYGFSMPINKDQIEDERRHFYNKHREVLMDLKIINPDVELMWGIVIYDDDED